MVVVLALGLCHYAHSDDYFQDWVLISDFIALYIFHRIRVFGNDRLYFGDSTRQHLILSTSLPTAQRQLPSDQSLLLHC